MKTFMQNGRDQIRERTRRFVVLASLGTMLVAGVAADVRAQDDDQLFAWIDLEPLDEGCGALATNAWTSIARINLSRELGGYSVLLQGRYTEATEQGVDLDCNTPHEVELTGVIEGEESRRSPLYRWNVDGRGMSLGRYRVIGRSRVVLLLVSEPGDADMGPGSSIALSIEWDASSRMFRIADSEVYGEREPRWVNAACDASLVDQIRESVDRWNAEGDFELARAFLARVSPMCVRNKRALERSVDSAERRARQATQSAPAMVDTTRALVGTWAGAGGATESFSRGGGCVYSEPGIRMTGRYRWLNTAEPGSEAGTTVRVLETTYRGRAFRWLMVFYSNDEYVAISPDASVSRWHRASR